MDKKVIRAVLDGIDAIVRAEGPWKKKRDVVLEECGDDDRTNLEEFAAWFEEAK